MPHVSRGFKDRDYRIPAKFEVGIRCFRFDNPEQSNCGAIVRLRIDPKGFIFYWRNEQTEFAESCEISSICDTRVGSLAKLPPEVEKCKEFAQPILEDLGNPIESSVLSIVLLLPTTGIVSNQNPLTSPVFMSFVLPSELLAQTWAQFIMDLSTDLTTAHGSVLDYLYRHYAKLYYCHQADRTILYKDIANSFGSARDAGKIENALKTAGLILQKGDRIPLERLTEEKFLLVYRYVTARSELNKIFNDFLSDGEKDKKTFMSVDRFVFFLNQQRDPRLNEILYPYYDRNSALRIIQQYEPSKDMQRREMLSIDGLIRYLMSRENGIISEEYLDLRTDDMDAPLTHYFICSSHNTYLIGKQIGGRATVEIYRQVLLTGCRCVELDCWNGTDEEPIITHGFAMVNELPFKEVIEAIAESAFKTTEYPLILSIENHCNTRMQEKMARYMKTIFGDMLLEAPLPNYPLKAGAKLPPVSDLKLKIILKNRKKASTDSRQSSVRTKPRTAGSVKIPSHQRVQGLNADALCVEKNSQSDGDLVGQVAEPLDLNSGPAAALSRSPSPSRKVPEFSCTPCTPPYDSDAPAGASDDTKSMSRVEPDDNSQSTTSDVIQQPIASPEPQPCEEDDIDDDDEIPLEDGTQTEITRAHRSEVEAGDELSELIIYVQVVKRYHEVFSFEAAEKRDIAFEVQSFNERKAVELLKQFPVEYVNYNRRQFSRIYPRAGRIDSSNYIPQTFWNAGCQMVALNYQILDLGMQLNLGLFDMNGRCGYMLKPECMRRKDRHLDPFEDTLVENVVANQLSIKKRVSTHVIVELFGLMIDTVRGYKSPKVENNGINPTYNSREFKFQKIILPELASLRLAVIEEGSTRVLGQRIIPVAGLRPGYRHIPLRNILNRPLALATLFVHISVKDYVPDAHVDLVRALMDPIAFFEPVNDFAEALVNPIAHAREKAETMLQKFMLDEEKHDKPMRALAYGSRTAASAPQMLDTSSTRKKEDSAPNPASPGSKAGPSAASQAGGAQANAIGRVLNLQGTPTAKIKIGQGGLIENYNYEIPSIEDLQGDKKALALQKKHDKEIEALKKKQQKEKDGLKAKLNFQTLGESMPRSPVSRFSRSLRMMSRRQPNESQKPKASNGAVSKGSYTTDVTMNESFVTLTGQQISEYTDLRKEHKQRMSMVLDFVLNDREATCTRIVNTRYQKECEIVMKNNHDSRRQDQSEVVKHVENKDEQIKKRNAIKERYVQSILEERRRLDNLRDQKSEELKTKFQEVRDQLAETLQQEIEDLETKYQNQASLGEFHFDDEITAL